MEFSDKEKLIAHASWLIAMTPFSSFSMKRAREIIESIRKNKCRKVTEEECKEIIECVISQFKDIEPFLDLLSRGDIPEDV